MSRAMTRPCGPVPCTIAMSIPASFASRRASGEEKTRAWPLVLGAGALAVAGAAGLGGAAAAAGAFGAGWGDGAAGGGVGRSAALGGGLAAAEPALLAAAFTSSPSPASTAI